MVGATPKHRRTDLARSPLVFDITPLKRQPGHRLPFVLSIEPPPGVVLATAEVVTDQLHIALQLEIVGEQLVAAGMIEVEWTGPCRRCLEDRSDRTEVAVQEIFEKAPVEGETYFLDKDEVDLEAMIRESVLLSLPVAPLCSDACSGPAPERFPTSVVADEVEPAEPPADPRWAALSDLTFEE